MATYTDLHNKIKETITVDYKDRVTTQPVKFLNGKNEYWGTLKGEISAENISINGGVLENVTIINPKLEGSFNLPEGVDLVQTAKDIAAISNDLIQTRQNLADELTARYHFDKIESETRASADIELKEAIKNAAISVNNVNDTLRKEFEDADKTLSVHFEGITDKLSNSFEEADKNIKDSLKTITNQLSDDIISVRMDLGKETFTRGSADKQLDEKINQVDINSNLRDLELADDLLKYSNQAKKELSETKDTLLSAIEKDRHYIINFGENGIKTTDTFPFNSKDFAVNIYDATVVDGMVKYTNNSGIHSIGEVTKDANGGIILKTFAKFTTSDLSEALYTNWLYEFESKKCTINATKGFTITVDGERDDLSDLKFVLKPVRTLYRKLTVKGEMIGKVLNAFPESTDNETLSGQLYIDTANTELDAFNEFKNVNFNKEDQKVNEKATERITYLGDNKFKLEKNIDIYEYISLLDDTSKEHFGKIYSYRNGLSGITFVDGVVDQINIDIDDSIYALKAVDNFKAVIKQDDKTIYQVSAIVEDTNAQIEYSKISNKYGYDFVEFNDEGEVIPCGRVIPEQYNKTLDKYQDFEAVQVDISKVMQIEAFKKNYILKKAVDKDTCWAITDIDNITENVLDIVFNISNVLIKVTSKNGDIIRKTFSVKADTPIISNPEEAYVILGKDTSVDLTIFDNRTEAPGGVYEAIIEPENISTNEQLIDNINVDISTTGLFKIKIPSRTTDDISREFSVVIKPKCLIDRLIEIVFVDDNNQPVQIFNNRHERLFIPTNKWTTLQLNEINYNKFFVKDMDEGEQEFEFNEIKATLKEEISNRISSDELIQQNLDDYKQSVKDKFISVDSNISYLSDEISTNWEATCLSTNNLCVALSDEIDRAILKENNLCSEIGYLSNQVSSISSYLSDAISLNDADIKYLSDEISANMLSTELSVSNLDGKINELSTHHANHYDKTFVETESLSGPDKIFDSLKIIDCDNTNDKYKLIFKDGTLVLEKLS